MSLAPRPNPRPVLERLSSELDRAMAISWPEKPLDVAKALVDAATCFAALRKDRENYTQRTVADAAGIINNILKDVMPPLKAAKHDTDGPLNYQMGRVLAVMDRMEDALFFLKRACKVVPKNGEYERVLKIVEKAISDKKAAATTPPPSPDAAKPFAAAAEDPKMAEYRRLCEQATEHNERGNAHGAARVFVQAVEYADRETLTPQSLHMACRIIADIKRRKLKDPEGALPYAARAYALNPDHFLNAREYGLCLSMNEKYIEATVPLRKALEIDPKKSQLIADIDLNYRKGQQPEEGWRFIEAEMARAPRSVNALRAAALHKIFTWKRAEAKPYIERIRAINPRSEHIADLEDKLVKKKKISGGAPSAPTPGHPPEP